MFLGSLYYLVFGCMSSFLVRQSDRATVPMGPTGRVGGGGKKWGAAWKIEFGKRDWHELGLTR